MLLKKWMLFAALCLSALSGLAQNIDMGTPPIHNFSSQLYKAHSQNWSAVQDRRGVMYFGNTNGIVEYDGVRWRLIQTPSKTVSRALAISPSGTIYYGSVGDFGYLKANENGKVQMASLRDKIPEKERQFNDVWQVFCVGDSVYFLTREKIFRYFKGQISVLAGRFATSQSLLFREHLFYIDADHGLSVIQGDEIRVLSAFNWLINGSRITMAAYGEHEILVSRGTGDMFILQLKDAWNDSNQHYEDRALERQQTARQFISPVAEFAQLAQASGYRMYTIQSNDQHPLFALTTLKAGLVFFNDKGEVQRVINKSTGLADNTVTNLFQDRLNHLWITTNAGLSYVEHGSAASYYGNAYGIDGNVLTTIRHKGELYVGSFQQMLVQEAFQFSFNTPHQKFVPVTYGLGNFWEFVEFDDELLASGALGLFRVRDHSATLIANSPINGYCLSRIDKWPDHLLMGVTGGLALFKKTANSWEFIGKIEGIRDNIRRISQDASGHLWLSTEVNGLYYAPIGDQASLKIPLTHIGKSEGLPALENIQAYSFEQQVFVTTPHGLYSLDRSRLQQSGEFHFRPDPAMDKFFNQPPRLINGIARDFGKGYFVSTESEVMWLVPDQQGRMQLNNGSFDGVTPPDMPINRVSANEYWIPGEILARITPLAPIHNDTGFKVLIRQITTKNKRSLLEGAFSTIASDSNAASMFIDHQSMQAIPELAFEENGLAFEFAAPYFANPNALAYRYKLIGFDQEWSDWSAVSNKEYSYIPHGSYQFQVQAKNGLGQISSTATYHFKILRPWYLSWWAILLWLVLGISAVMLTIQLHTKKLVREKQTLEDLVNLRTQELREASLTDPLTGLRNRRFMKEVLNNDISAFIKYKNYILDAKNKRSNVSDKEVFGIFLLDMDHFKHVNDQYGHEGGDRVLREFSSILKSCVRQDDVVVRLGGEEFLVVLKKTMPEFLHVFAQRLLKKVAETEFHLDHGIVLHKTCSIGYVAYPFDQDNPDLLSFDQTIALADLAMYHAKNEGRNRAIYLSRGAQWTGGDDYLEQILTSLEFGLSNSYLCAA
ncbi:MAG: GGDEF domain-containing protein [Burkholderiales bacterium]|nr:GGDEF domain-containing protein [Burkholderiales bacterium]